MSATQMGGSHPYLVMFMSIDISGSTAFKREHPNEWMDIFHSNFFIGAGQLLRNFWRQKCRALHGPRSKRTPGRGSLEAMAPAVWKTNGDEILFHLQIEELSQVWIALDAFTEFVKYAMDKLESAKLLTPGPSGLSAKGCAWLGNFPEFNKRISVADLMRGANRRSYSGTPGGSVESTASHQVTAIPEYLGPSIDAGFRIAGYAERNRLVISIELAIAVLRLADIFRKPNNLELMYEEGEPLKGILPGIEFYPRIVIDLNTGRSETEHIRALRRSFRHGYDEYDIIRDACKYFIRTYPSRFFDVDTFFDRDPIYTKDPPAPEVGGLLPG